MPLKALFLVSIISNTEINIYFKCTNLKVVFHITLIVLVIGKAQFRRAMLSCDSSCKNSLYASQVHYLFWQQTKNTLIRPVIHRLFFF